MQFHRPMANHPIRCRCGTLQGLVRVSPGATRALCYCSDCQAYARFLDDSVLDGAGGTEVVATAPRQVQFVSGLESLACLSLSPRGLLRWYAQCCRTPLGNTPRNYKLAYVGLVHSCLGEEPARQASFGAVRIAVNTKSALGPVPSLAFGSRVAALFNLGSSLLGARLSGSYEQTPFFEAGSHAPIRAPYVLSKTERAQAYGRGTAAMSKEKSVKVNGSCHCGRITYEAEVDPERVRLCNCTDCQVLSGSAFRVSVPALAGTFRFLTGQPKVYVKTADSGAQRRHTFCPDCGAPISASADTDNPPAYTLRVGALAQRAELPPRQQIWCRSALDWVQDIRSVPGVQLQ